MMQVFKTHSMEHERVVGGFFDQEMNRCLNKNSIIEFLVL